LSQANIQSQSVTGEKFLYLTYTVPKNGQIYEYLLGAFMEASPLASEFLERIYRTPNPKMSWVGQVGAGGWGVKPGEAKKGTLSGANH
jgi:hypothetical protein